MCVDPAEQSNITANTSHESAFDSKQLVSFPPKMKLMQITFKNSVLISNKTEEFFTINIVCPMLLILKIIRDSYIQSGGKIQSY
jgi:hypothetical protein